MSSKYIFVTGGVCSSLGKGISSSSIGALLEACGFKIAMTKVDPYINVDAGTMSPYQHGEVFVTDDGAETDLDLGNYERFTTSQLTKRNSITTGQVYNEVISRERRGDYLGRCVQVIPHITDEIRRRIKDVAKDADVTIIEIGGTVGDIESVPFLEAARQFITDVGKDNVIFVHLTLVPQIHAADEFKTKPTQHSVQKLREIGIQPDILLCRLEGHMPLAMKKKISLFTNVEEDAIIEATTVKSIYEVPTIYDSKGMTDVLLRKLRIPTESVHKDLSIWQNLSDKIHNLNKSARIAVVGKYIELQDAYKSIYEALNHAGIANGAKLEVHKIQSDNITAENVDETLKDMDGILIPGGFGDRGVEGKILTAQYAREHKIPFFGICLGMQIMVIEYARNVLGLPKANSTECDTSTDAPVISLLEEQAGIDNKGGTMRLGSYDSVTKEGTLLRKAYGTQIISERHRHRYEFNNDYRQQFIDKGLIIAGVYEEENLVESVEWPDHPFGIGVQFHPEFKSKPFSPHPIFRDFIAAALANKEDK